MRLLDLRLGCSSLDTLSLSGACKAVLCLELAADGYGQPISKVQSTRANFIHILDKLYPTSNVSKQILLPKNMI